jgi:hypothetical protein
MHAKYGVVSQQWRGETNSDQYWGALLAAKEADGYVYECYLTPDQVANARKDREREEAARERQRRARVEASRKELKELGPSRTRVTRRPKARQPLTEPSGDLDGGERAPVTRATLLESEPEAANGWGDWRVWVVGLLLVTMMALIQLGLPTLGGPPPPRTHWLEKEE